VTEREVGARADIRHPPAVTGRAREKVEHVQIDTEERRDFSEAELDAGPHIDIAIENRSERAMAAEHQKLGIETDAGLYPQTKASGGAFDRVFSLPDGLWDVALLKAAEIDPLTFRRRRVARGPLLGVRSEREQEQDRGHGEHQRGNEERSHETSEPSIVVSQRE
jgi:hypothetical protein